MIPAGLHIAEPVIEFIRAMMKKPYRLEIILEVLPGCDFARWIRWIEPRLLEVVLHVVQFQVEEQIPAEVLELVDRLLRSGVGRAEGIRGRFARQAG